MGSFQHCKTLKNMSYASFTGLQYPAAQQSTIPFKAEASTLARWARLRFKYEPHTDVSIAALHRGAKQKKHVINMP